MNLKFSTLALLAFSCLGLHAADWFVDGGSRHGAPTGSQDSPFRTIQAALNKATSGDTITVAQGIYREGLRYRRHQHTQPLVLRAAAGARPVISGFRRVKGWRLGADGLYRSRVAYKPHGLLINGVYQQLVRLPEAGWLRMNHTGGYSFTADMKEDIPVGATCYVWIAWGNVYGKVSLKASRPGCYELEKPWFRMSQNPKSPDRCFFVNHPALIRKSGQWAWKQVDKKTFDVYLKLDTPMEEAEILIGGASTPLDIRDVSNMSISGFDVVGSGQHGLFLTGSKKVTVSDMGCFWNATSGFWLRGCDDVTVENLRIACNQTGMTTMGNKNVVIRGCEFGNNFEDGLTVTWKSDHVLVEGNRFHHQISWGHPDNIQMYRGVDHVTLRNNLLFCSGQGIMAEQVSNITLDNNLIVGTDAVSVIWGHQSCSDIIQKHNTILFGGWGEIAITGKGYEFTDNILMGNDFSKKAIADHAYKGKRNHFVTHEDGWFGKENGRRILSFQNYLRQSGEANHTREKFPIQGLPGDMSVISCFDIAECTRDTICLRQKSASRFHPGDIIEINYDNVPRTVTAISGRSITFTPSMDYPPMHPYIVLNWKNQKDMTWSPQFKTKAGSTISFDRIRKDACTTVPLPAPVQQFIQELPRLIPPHKL